MVDQLTELESPPVFVSLPEDKRFEKTVSSFRRDLKADLSNNGELSLDELINKVYDWENVYGEQLSDTEFEVLTVLSLVLGTTKTAIEKSVGSKGIETHALKQSVETQQEITRLILGDLDENGRPNRATAKMFGLVTEIFDEYFDPKNPKLTTPGAEVEGGLWQGIQGMVTSALLFREAGWEVKFPPINYDIKYEIDLLARNKEGEIFAIDITARTPKKLEDGTMETPFYAMKKPVPRNIPPDVTNGLKGFIRLNVPPLRTDPGHEFYEDRLSGFPTEQSIENFKQMIK